MNLTAPISLVPTAPAAPVTLSIVLRTPSKNRLLAREPVADSDLVQVRSEAWLECFLRKGWTNVPFADASLRLVPIFVEGSDSQCSGFGYEGATPDGQPVRCEFTIRCLTDVAHRAADRLVERGVLQPNEKFTYEVVVDREPRVAPPPAAAGTLFAVSITTPLLQCLSVPLAPLLRRARAMNAPDDAVFPVLFTEHACEQAERISRKGALQSESPVETGGALAGPICSSDDGEFFVVVTHVLEAVDAETKTFSLQYSSASWKRIQTVIKARQASQPALRLIGQAHGHNFLPKDGKTCEACPTRDRCDATNLFCSSDDREWTRAVFCHQPWGLCLIYGLSARGDKLQGLYSLRDGRLRERGYFVLPEFDPDQWEIKPQPELKTK
jgi:hypothetical protein